MDALASLETNDAPRPYSAVLHPQQMYGSFGLSNDLAITQTSSSTGAFAHGGAVSVGEQFYRAGFVTNIAGIDFFTSPQVIDGSTGRKKGAIYSKTAIGAGFIDFGAGNEKSIDKFRYYVTNPASCTWSIQYSSNGSSWTDAATGWVTDDTTGTNQWKEKSFTAPSNSSANPNGTLIQSANAVSGARTKVGGTLLYKDNAGTNNLGTEIKVYFTCDGGLNWTEASSYTAITPVYYTGIKQVRLGETTCTSGQDVRYKIEWESQGSGTKEAQIHGIGINY